MAETETAIFNDQIDQFSHFYQDDLLEELPEEDFDEPGIIDTLPASDTINADATQVEEAEIP